MEYQQYITYSFPYLALNALKWAAIFVAIIGLPFFLVFLFKKTESVRHALFNALVGAAFAGVLVGGFTPGFLAQDDNRTILNQNIAKKYDAQVTEQGMKNRDAYSPTDKQQHKVMIMANGKSMPAYLQQDEKTNEPTLFNYDTKQPLTDILKAK